MGPKQRHALDKKAKNRTMVRRNELKALLKQEDSYADRELMRLTRTDSPGRARAAAWEELRERPRKSKPPQYTQAPTSVVPTAHESNRRKH